MYNLVKQISLLFFLHAIVDGLVALLIFIYPRIAFIIGFVQEDDIAYYLIIRIVGAALFAITVSSYLSSYYKNLNDYIPLLNFKIIWSGFNVVGSIVVIIEYAVNNKSLHWVLFVVLSIFLVGNVTWSYYRIQIFKYNVSNKKKLKVAKTKGKIISSTAINKSKSKSKNKKILNPLLNIV